MTTFPPHPLDFLKSSSAMYPTNPHIQHCNLMSYSNNKPWRRLIVHVVPRLTWRIAGCARIICESRIRRTVLIARNGPGVSPGAMGKIYRFTALPGTSNCVNLSSVFFSTVIGTRSLPGAGSGWKWKMSGVIINMV